MAVSAEFTVNGNSNPRAHSAAYGSIVTLAFTGLNGAGVREWSIVGVSKSGQAIPTIVPGGNPSGATATFQLPSNPGDGLGRCFRVKGRVANGREEDIKYAVVGVLNANGILPFCPDERDERDRTQGWTDTINGVLAGGSAAAVRVAHGVVNVGPVALPGGVFGDTSYTSSTGTVVVSGIAVVKVTFPDLPGSGRGAIGIQAGFNGSFGYQSAQYYTAAMMDPSDFTYMTTIPFDAALLVGTSERTIQFNAVAAAPDGDATDATIEVFPLEFTITDVSNIL